MSVYLDTIRFSVLIFPAIALALTIPVWFVHRRWFGELHEYRAAIFYAFAFYFATACLMTVLPLPKQAAAFCEAHGSVARTQLVPLESFADIARYAQAKGLGWSPGGIIANMAFWQIAFNVLLLLPFGLLMRKLYGLSFVATAAAAFALSLFLETTQLTGVWGLAPCPYRLFDVDDLLTNTTGAMIGWCLLPLFRWLPDPQDLEDRMWYRRNGK